MKKINILISVLMGGALLFKIFFPTPTIAQAVTNLITNPSFETVDPTNNTLPQNWLEGKWGTNTTTFSYPSTGNTGSHSAQVQMTSYSSGDAKWYFTPVAVQSNTQYTFNDYYQSTVATSIIAQFDDGSGNLSYQNLILTVPASSTWAQTNVTFTTPANAKIVTFFHLISSVGTLTTDDYSLTTSTVVVTPPPVITPPVINTAIANPGVEIVDPTNSVKPENWQSNSWGTNTTTFSYLPTGHTGNHSVQVQTTAYTSGDSKWYFDPVAVVPGTQYAFSDYYQSTVASELDVAFTMTNGTTQYLYLGTPAPSATWNQFNATFTAPVGAQSASVYHVIYSVGTLTTDDFSLAPTPVVVQTTFIPNPSVETVDPSNSAMPQNWQNNAWGTNTTTFSYLSTGHTGTHSVKVQMSAYTDGDAKWFFTPQAVTPGLQYQFSDYYQATVATEVDVAFDMSDGTTLYQILGLPEPSSTWAKFTTQFSIPLGAQKVTIYHLIHQVGSLTLDDENIQSYVPVGYNRALLSLTFDDGYSTTYAQGIPLLTKYGFNSTQFIITNLIGKNGYMTNAQIKALYTAGHEIASHTVTHNNMLLETASQWTTELANSQTTLQNLIGTAVTEFAFPNGLYNSGIVAATKKYYKSARGTEDALNSKDNFNIYDIKVQNVYDTTTVAQIQDWINQAQATKTWLVLVYHSVDSNVNSTIDGGIYNVTPTQLDAELSAIKTTGITVLPMNQALTELLPQMGL